MLMSPLYVFIFLQWLIWTQANTNLTSGGFMVSKEGCQITCGNLTVPYPFGIGVNSGCSMGPYYDVNCRTVNEQPRAFWSTTDTIEILAISDSEVRTTNFIGSKCYDQFGGVVSQTESWTNLGDGPYTFSGTANKVIVVGCADVAIVSGNGVHDFSGGCVSWCQKKDDVHAGICNGIGCCQFSIPKGLKSFSTSMARMSNLTSIWSFDPCSYALLGDYSRFNFSGAPDFKDAEFTTKARYSMPLVLDWVIGSQSCTEARNSSSMKCLQNTYCNDSDSGYGGYRCGCKMGFVGNPYLSPGCEDFDECMDRNKNDCHENAKCKNEPGNFTCHCKVGYYGEGRNNTNGCIKKTSQLPVIKFAIGISFGFLALLIAIALLYFGIKKRNLIKLRENFYRRNGGLIMNQQITKKGSIDSSKVFTAEELKRATNNYSNDRILGRGGYGVVYKGILPDERVIAIKKSRMMDESQIEVFINEVVILGQINHRNVVKLLGCCLETEVPLLVYEYISNGTLFHHIHENGLSWLSWNNRLRIASEAANALAYLHSAASIPIIHRDVKSANILLDDQCIAKMADFGASRLVPLEQAQVTTLVQGTLGYLDPEYFCTSQLTEKSDVYSFGVVLAELMTGKEVLSSTRPLEERFLGSHFIVAVNENRLFQILEPRVTKEGTFEQLNTSAELVKRCLMMRGEDRPTMKEVASELEGLMKFTQPPWAQEHGQEESLGLVCEPLDIYTVPVTDYPSIDGSSEIYSMEMGMTLLDNIAR